MKALGIIPARYAATRFPGKPLADIGGQPMIEHVYRRAVQAASLDTVVVATDDRRIYDCVNGFGGRVVMTGAHHASGTERCVEALDAMPGTWDVVVNVQGDEPFVDPAHIDALTAVFTGPSVYIATLVRSAGDRDVTGPDLVKAVVDLHGEVLYFSRSVIPYPNPGGPFPLLHAGLYAYRPSVLRQIAALAPTPLEKAESLEQLRWLENGWKIRTVHVDGDHHAVDTPADLERLKSTFRL